MALQDHMKIAAAELAKASTLAKQEANQLRSQSADLQKNVNLQVARLSQQMKLHEQEINNTDDPTRRSQARSAITSLQRQIADSNSQLKKDLQRIQDTIRQKEDLIDSLEQQSRSVSP